MKKKHKESLIVASKIKTYIKRKKMLTSSDALEALNEKIYCLLDCAIARTKANRRSTVKAQDIGAPSITSKKEEKPKPDGPYPGPRKK